MPALGLSERKRRSTSNNVNNPSPPSSPVQPYTPNLGVVALSTTELPKANMASSTSYSPQVADESPDEATPGAIPHAWSSNGAGPSNSTTQLLTPQSPLSLPPSYVRPIPESPLTNPYLHPTLGAAFSPRNGMNHIAPMEARMKRPGFSRAQSGQQSVQLTPPASSPIEPRSSSRLQAAMASGLFPDDESIISTPSGSISSIAGLEPPHEIRSRSSSSPATHRSITPGPNTLKPLGNLASPIANGSGLLPAFGDSFDENSRTHRSSSPAGRSSGAEDVIDDVFRMNSSGLSRSSSISDIKPLRRPPPVGRGVDARRIQSTMSEPRPLRSATQRAVPATPIPDHVKNGAGISFSPIKGRRIQLQRPASPAPAPVVAPAPLSPKPPPPPAAVSNITMQWLQSGPATPRHQRIAESSPDSAERELKKRKRLQAFVDTSVGLASPSKNKNKSPLKPVEVKGMGRLALHPKELKVEWVTVATPRRSGKRRGKRRANDGTPSHRKKLTAFGLDVREDPLKAKRRRPPGVQSDSEDEDSDADHPAWPDQEYPWSETKPKQRELSPGERARIQQLERFFDRGTDDEDSEDDYDGAVLPVVEQAPPPPVPRVPSTGGKLGSRPTLGNTPLLSRSMSAASDQGDARAAIFARQKDRPSIGRSSSGQVEVGVAEYIPSDANDNDAVAVDPDSQDEEEDDGIINCLCGKEHADVPMVRCDSCHTWTHLECVGIEDESQLADEWFCYNCEQRKLAEQAEDLPVEPTFTLTTETPRPRIPAYMKFYNPFGGFTDTPLFPSNTSDVRGMTLKPPVTPKTSTFSSSRFRTPSWDTSAFPSNNLITPRTPNMQKQLDMRAYTTPKFFPGEKDNAPAGPSHFDPLSTPSRGLDLGTPFLHSSSSDRYFTGANPNPPTTPLHRIIPNAFPQSSGMTDALLRRPVMYFPGTGGGSPTHSTPPAPFPTITTKGKEALRNPALS